MYKNVTILGAGSWGMAIARLLDANGLTVRLWEYNAVDFDIIRSTRTHPKKLPVIHLNESILLSNNLPEAVSNAELIVSAVPSQFLRPVLTELKQTEAMKCGFVNLAKGIETTTLKRMSEVIHEELGTTEAHIATVSGPSHAEEVALDMPTAIVAAGKSEEFIIKIQESFSNQSLRVYQSADLIGVELGGSLKNIIAIAAGICHGLLMGDNTMGALLTRGLAEISRLGVAMGAQAETFAGLSGIGDLVTTCMSKHSRNRYVGEKIGQGMKLEQVLAEMSMVAEGVETTKSGYKLAQQLEVEMPITFEVYEVLFNNKPADIALGDLMRRELKAEIWQ